MDRTVAPGFTRIGYAVRSTLPTWPDDPRPDALLGRTVLVTGGSSGLGITTAEGLGRLGATVHLVVRDVPKGEAAAAELRHRVGANAGYRVWACDVADLDSVRRFTEAFAAEVPSLDVLVHNAGALPAHRLETAQGHEFTMAVHVLGPILMTERLRPQLAGHQARVVFVTSGGMYTQKLRADDPDFHDGAYAGAVAYARSKRAQIELLPVLERRWGVDGIRVYATHPGWADTPGVSTSLPAFRRITGPFLRPSDMGSDTTVWISAIEPPPPGGGLWHDRRERPTHLTRATRSATADEDRRQMWEWTRTATGLDETTTTSR